MKRAAWYVVTGAVTGFLSLLGLHAVTAAPDAVPAAAGSGEGSGISPVQPAGSTSPSETETAVSGGQGSSRGKGPGSASGPARQAAGAVESYGYGELAVTVTVKGADITSVAVPVLRVNDPPSAQIASYALPQLKAEVLAVNSARIHAISGATYTSDAYAASLQSALDKLHLL